MVNGHCFWGVTNLFYDLLSRMYTPITCSTDTTYWLDTTYIYTGCMNDRTKYVLDIGIELVNMMYCRNIAATAL